MNDIQIFKNEEFGEVRTLVMDNEPWFVGNDVASILGYSQTAKAVREHVDTEDKGVSVLDTPGGSQQVVIINESGMYSLILSSKLPTAKKFKRWVTSEVLPAIRKTGGYMVAQQDETPEQLVAKKLHECAGIINEAYDEIFNLYNGNTDLIDDHYDRTISEVNDFANFMAGCLGLAIVDSSK